MSAAAASAKAQKSTETREAILAASLKLFARNGFASTSMDDIARAAGLTKGALYWHFTSKETLFQAILGRMRSRWLAVVFQAVPEEGSASRRLEALFEGFLELFSKDPQIGPFLQRVLLDDDEEFSPQAGRLFRLTARFIARILDDGKRGGEFRGDIDCLATAHAVVGALLGANQQSLAARRLMRKALLEEAKQMTLARVRR